MTSDGAPSATVQPSAFLDSNVLVRLFLYWDACEQANIRLDAVPDWATLKAELASAGVNTDILNKDDAELVDLGRKVFECLSASSGSYRYLASQVCWAEMHHVLLEARGLERLVRQGIPYSLRVKRPEALYRVSLQEPDYLRLEAQIDTFRISLNDDYGLDVFDVDGYRRRPMALHQSDIWASAQAIWSRVLMAVIDAYLCSAAIRARADAFVSADTNLRNALQQLRDPNGDWSAAAQSLCQALGIGAAEELPQPINPNDALPEASP